VIGKMLLIASGMLRSLLASKQIRAERKGEGISLTRQQARALAGEWYNWFIARYPTTDLEQWDAVRERVHEALREAVGDAEWERSVTERSEAI
jgi:hypothetical protein